MIAAHPPEVHPWDKDSETERPEQNAGAMPGVHQREGHNSL